MSQQPALSKSKSQLARDEDTDNFVIPQKYAMSMMMFQMASGGKNTITLPQITNMAAMPLQMAMMQSGALLEGLLSAGPLASAPPAIKELIKEYDAKFKNNLRDNLDTLLKPLFSIIDGNDSGTISKREFFHLARIGEIGKQLQGMRGPPNAGQVKEIFDAIYDLVDINQDGAISKSEISGLLQRILVGLGEVPQALLQIISDTLDQNFFDTIAKAGFEFLPMLKMMGVDITDEKGNIMYTKCAPFLAMADGAVKAKAQQAMLQDKAKKAVEKYMEAEKKYLERLSKLADKDGFVTKDDYMTLMSTIANEASDILKEQVTTGLTHLPPSSQQIAMLVAGFVDPASILKSVITAKPFIFERTLSAMFDNFGTNGKLNLSGLRSIYECIAGVADARVKDSDPATRMKAVFDLIDADQDGTISPSEAAKLICAFFKTLIAALGEGVLFYLRLFSNEKLVSGGCSALEAVSASGGLGPFQIKFPVKRLDVDALLAKLMGTTGKKRGISREEMMKEIFKFQDHDRDNMLTFHEFNYLSDRMDFVTFKTMCSMGSDPNRIDFNGFKMQYENGVDLDADYAKVQNFPKKDK